METFKWCLPPLGSAIMLFGGTKFDLLMLTYIGFRKYRHNIPFVDSLAFLDTIRFIAILSLPYVILQVIRLIKGLRQTSTIRNDLPLKPCFFPCRTFHSRIFPVRHSFSYSYLLTGIPIGYQGSVGGLISVDEKGDNSWFTRKAWFTVNSDDYLARYHHPDGLQGKLRDYLQSQGVDHNFFSHAYLFTAAKFLGYSSNPVSIWHLYSSQNTLKALVLEVNNTFDERHSYFLQPSSNALSTAASANPEVIRYTSSWSKDFYVSTFNDRSGCYSLSATDPFAPVLTGNGHINTNITLSGPSDSKPMIVTVLRSSETPLNPADMSILNKLQFLYRWWWVGFATFPRTLQQAFILFFRRKMPWAFRPEPRRNTISRPADETEKLIEQHFYNFLETSVEQCHEAITVRYRSSGLIGQEDTTNIFHSPSSLTETRMEIDIVVLTPAFYSNLVRYASLREAFISESTGDQTISLSDHSFISKLTLGSSLIYPNYLSLSSIRANSLAKHLLVLTSCFRKSNHHSDSQGILSIVKSKAPFSKLSELDIFVLQHSSHLQLKAYTWELMRLTIIDHIAFGSIMLWNLEVFVARTIAAWLILYRIFD